MERYLDKVQSLLYSPSLIVQWSEYFNKITFGGVDMVTV